MPRTFVLNRTIRLPRFLVWLILPAAISLTIMLAYSIAISLILGPSTDFNILQWFPFPVTVALIVWGAYTGIGSVALWIAMWFYWVGLERSSFWARTGWFFTLLLGMHLGALVYVIYIWKKGFLKAEFESPNAPPMAT